MNSTNNVNLSNSKKLEKNHYPMDVTICFISNYLLSSPESCPGQCGLPSCVQQKNSDVTADQKNRDSTLPRLLYELDEACKKDSNDAEKSNLANACLKAASSPNRKYRILKFFELLENNKVLFHYYYFKMMLQVRIRVVIRVCL
jgi:hypothetical protein